MKLEVSPHVRNPGKFQRYVVRRPKLAYTYHTVVTDFSILGDLRPTRYDIRKVTKSIIQTAGIASFVEFRLCVVDTEAGTVSSNRTKLFTGVYNSVYFSVTSVIGDREVGQISNLPSLWLSTRP